MKKLIHALLAGTFFSGAACATPDAVPLPTSNAAVTQQAPDADPALWVLRDADTTIYLFGTMHLLKDELGWFDDEVKAAYDAAGEIVLEIAQIDPQATQQAFLARAVVGDGVPLARRLPLAINDTLNRALASAGVPAGALDRFEPWAAAMVLSTLPMARLGYKAELGPDHVISTRAAVDGKVLTSLESIERQLDMHDQLSQEAQAQMLANAAGALDTLPARLDEMVAAWAAGETERVGALVAYTMEGSPELERAMLTERNTRWAEWIQGRLDRPGTVFMAVGAAHLAGPNSVQNLLAARGITTRRVPQSPRPR